MSSRAVATTPSRDQIGVHLGLSDTGRIVVCQFRASLSEWNLSDLRSLIPSLSLAKSIRQTTTDNVCSTKTQCKTSNGTSSTKLA
jgi:hypothetical protein